MSTTLLNKIQSILFDAGLDNEFRRETRHHAVYLQNLVPANEHKVSLMEFISKQKFDVSHLKVSGCLVEDAVQNEVRGRLEPKSRNLIHTGHIDLVMSRAFNPRTNMVQLLRQGVFDERVFPEFASEKNALKRNHGPAIYCCDKSTHHANKSCCFGLASNVEEVVFYNSAHDSDPIPEECTQNMKTETTVQTQIPCASPSPHLEHIPDFKNAENIPICAQRSRRPPERYSYAAATRRGHNDDEPTVAQALRSKDSDNWKSGTQEEIESLNDRKTWELVPRPERVKILPSKIILKLKRHADGTTDKYEARLVALGCFQRSTDVDCTFSPVVDFSSVRVALALAALRDYDVHQMDVTGAFLYG